MSTFPALVPSSRTFTPGEYPATAFSGFSGAQNRVRHSNVFLAAQLRLTFLGLDEAEMLDIWDHYSNRQGEFRSFALPTEIVSNGSITDYVPGNYLWRYAGPGSVEDLPCGGHNVSLTLETVPPIAASVVGADLFLRLRLRAGVADGGEYAPGINETVALSLTSGDAFVAINGISETIGISLESGEAAGDVSVFGVDEGIVLLFDAGAALELRALGISETLTLSLSAGAATNGDIEYEYEVFLSSGTWNWVNAGSPSTVDVLLVAGGGGGGSRQGGGGGAGGVRIAENVSVSGNVTITIGAGGAGGTSGGRGANGSNSSFGSESATGGGGGGGRTTDNSGNSGGSGGGSAGQDVSGGTGSSGQGSNGGRSNVQLANSGGGGGGKSEPGSDAANVAEASNKAGDGGDGITLASIGWDDAIAAGAPSAVGGGGGGACFGNTTGFGVGGLGGGANGVASGSPSGSIAGNPGTANTGGGGGGSFASGDQGGSGGSGLVIVRWIA